MTSKLMLYLKEKAKYIEQAMPAFLPEETPKQLLESMQYSLFAGGKRIRPVLILATIEALGKDSTIGLPVAVAIEMIHTYSLIHDDLPAMDNDDFRRGKPTNHKLFGDATAILAGDGLLTDAFGVVCRLSDYKVDASLILQIVKELAYYAGSRGMVGGQMADLLGERKQLSLPELQYIHEHKTADLLVFCIRAGAILGGATEEQLELLSLFGRNVGLAFQIQDDILDIYGEEEKIGKPVGSDQLKEKSTYPHLIGLEQSRAELDRLVAEGKLALKQSGIEGSVLEAIADFIIQREN
ncbi:MAG TPA: farnesyl diphosphate synthase [Bacillota bacterium]|nr:farnesyl diphosphate synthase [Bacillota bacterium]